MGLIVMQPLAAAGGTPEPLQVGAATSTTSRAPLTWEQVLVERSRLEAAGREADVVALLERFVITKPKRYEPYVALAQLLEKQGKYGEAADSVRNGRKAVPNMPAMFVLLLTQYRRAASDRVAGASAGGRRPPAQ